MSNDRSVAVLGGGFFGASIAEFVAARGWQVVLFEREHALLTRSSYRNQARLHGGYHYPRSFGTAYRSRLNFSRFFDDFQPAIVDTFVKLYAIAKPDSKVAPRQFEAFCANIGAPLRPANPRYSRLFSPRLIESVYEAEEYVFDAAVLRRLMEERLARVGVCVKLGTEVIKVSRDSAAAPVLLLSDGREIAVSRMFNCTYSMLNSIPGLRPTSARLKHEISELSLVELPPELKRLSVTVMDGPFFSFMPFPDRGLSTLSHVRYTPHAAWVDGPGSALENPYAVLASATHDSAFGFMMRDAARYMPCFREAVHRDSLFEVKTVLARNESDDGRPILFEWDAKDPFIVSVLGSKIDNVYDALLAVKRYLDQS